MNCIFSNPINLGEGDFEFSEMECDTTEITSLIQEGNDIRELIQNPTYPDRQFFVQKTLTYGEAIIVWFLTIFTIYLITKTIFDFFWKNK